MEKISISEIIIKQIEALLGRPLTTVETLWTTAEINDAAKSLELKLSAVASSTAERIKHDSRI